MNFNEIDSDLLKIIMNSFLDSGNEFDDITIKKVCNIFRNFINKNISFDESKNHLKGISGAVLALEKLNSILNVPQNPLPKDKINYSSNIFSPRRKTKPWNTFEDNRLIYAVHTFPKNDWDKIAKFVGNSRSKYQCAQRWNRNLDPNIDKKVWNIEEETKLIKLVEKYGGKSWKAIAKEMGNRCDVQCRYRYGQIINKKSYNKEISSSRSHPEFDNEKDSLTDESSSFIDFSHSLPNIKIPENNEKKK